MYAEVFDSNELEKYKSVIIGFILSKSDKVCFSQVVDRNFFFMSDQIKRKREKILNNLAQFSLEDDSVKSKEDLSLCYHLSDDIIQYFIEDAFLCRDKEQSNRFFGLKDPVFYKGNILVAKINIEQQSITIFSETENELFDAAKGLADYLGLDKKELIPR